MKLGVLMDGRPLKNMHTNLLAIRLRDVSTCYRPFYPNTESFSCRGSSLLDTFGHPCHSRLSCPCCNLVLGHLQEDTHKASERFQRYFENIVIMILQFYLIAHGAHLGHVTIATMDALVKSRRGSRRLLTRPLPEIFIE